MGGVDTERLPAGRAPDLSEPREPAFDQPPIEIELFQEVGSLRLKITRHYGHWIDASPASERLNGRLEALRAAGWALNG